LAEEYKAAKDALTRAIVKEKARAWDELVLALDQDPWGRPYKIVLNKLKGGATPITETQDPLFVQRVVTTLFPAEEGVDPIPAPESGPEWEDELGVTQGELRDAIRKIKSSKAPGPDSVHGRVWVLAKRLPAIWGTFLLGASRLVASPPSGKGRSSSLSRRRANRGTDRPLTAPFACWTRLARFWKE